MNNPINFLYRNHRNEISQRFVRPYRLVYMVSDYYPDTPPRWYLVGWDCGKEAEREFALDRMSFTGKEYASMFAMPPIDGQPAPRFTLPPTNEVVEIQETDAPVIHIDI